MFFFPFVYRSTETIRTRGETDGQGRRNECFATTHQRAHGQLFLAFREPFETSWCYFLASDFLVHFWSARGVARGRSWCYFGVLWCWKRPPGNSGRLSGNSVRVTDWLHSAAKRPRELRAAFRELRAGLRELRAAFLGFFWAARGARFGRSWCYFGAVWCCKSAPFFLLFLVLGTPFGIGFSPWCYLQTTVLHLHSHKYPFLLFGAILRAFAF